MAASVVSLTPFDRQFGDRSGTTEAEGDDELDWVLPSEVDCLGRPLPRVALTVTLRKRLSFAAIKSFIASLRQPAF